MSKARRSGGSIGPSPLHLAQVFRVGSAALPNGSNLLPKGNAATQAACLGWHGVASRWPASGGVVSVRTGDGPNEDPAGCSGSGKDTSEEATIAGVMRAVAGRDGSGTGVGRAGNSAVRGTGDVGRGNGGDP